jgi:hypothetical protein
MCITTFGINYDEGHAYSPYDSEIFKSILTGVQVLFSCECGESIRSLERAIFHGTPLTHTQHHY